MPRKRRKTVQSVASQVPAIATARSNLLAEAEAVHNDILDTIRQAQSEEHQIVASTSDQVDELAPEPSEPQPAKMSLVELKQRSERPDLMEWYDANSPDPLFLARLKAYPGTVQVPDTWQGREFRQKYSRSKPYRLPRNIYETGITQLRDVHENPVEEIQQLAKDRVQPKLGTLDLDLPKMKAAFQHQERPQLCLYGQVLHDSEYSGVPGKISARLAQALDMKSDDPPWLAAMNVHGYPPAYGGVRPRAVDAPRLSHWGEAN